MARRVGLLLQLKRGNDLENEKRFPRRRRRHRSPRRRRRRQQREQPRPAPAASKYPPNNALILMECPTFSKENV